VELGLQVKILAEDETDLGVINTGVLFMGYLFWQQLQHSVCQTYNEKRRIDVEKGNKSVTCQIARACWWHLLVMAGFNQSFCNCNTDTLTELNYCINRLT